MKYFFTLILLLFIGGHSLWGQPANLIWNSPSRNSSESMPCGGGDIGMNVWLEDDDILFYICRSGSFDENNTLLKQGRFRVRLTPNPFLKSDFKQVLCLKDGYVVFQGNGSQVSIWVDVFKPVVHVDVDAKELTSVRISYESWRTEDRPITKLEGQQCSYKWAIPEGLKTTRDSIRVGEEKLTFFHRNPERTVFDVAVEQQGMASEKERLYNPLRNLIFGGRISGDNMLFMGTRRATYAETDFNSWIYKSKKIAAKQSFQITLHTAQGTIAAWEEGLANTEKQVNAVKDQLATRRWWNEFWERSFIEGEGEPAQAIRNYTLFRYMLGCNAYGAWPTKFNGGLFTFDPGWVNGNSGTATPDFRKWGGGTMTAQNQRLVYWPMLKSGDYDMMKSQFDFYLRLLPTAEARSRVYWGHAGACFAEQIENFGLPNPAEYSFKRPEGFDKGMEYNAWLEYQWDTALEFCQMILETSRYDGQDISRYIPLIESTLNFFDQHYRYLALKRGCKDLTDNGKLILYPGSACETYKMAYNASSTVAALRSVLKNYGRKPDMMSRIPEIPLRTIGGNEMIAPAVTWERVNNVETPQLYPVFPWRIYGVGKPDLEIARNTYLYDADAQKFRSHEGWKQDNIWAACLGLTEEAAHLTLQKLADGPYRFPAFWGPGFDWSPDHNWGGSGMIGMQEMLLQEADGKILLFPSWPSNWNVHFKLHASGKTTVEATLKKGELTQLIVLPKEREKDIVNCLLENK